MNDSLAGLPSTPPDDASHPWPGPLSGPASGSPLDTVPPDDYRSGLVHRRRVLGDAWVERSLASRNDFNAEFQQLITRHAWNDIWGRPALGDRTRRFMVLSMMLGIHAWEEFALHVRAALDGPPESRLAPDEIKEVILMAAIYCGVPVANHAFGIATGILREKGLLGAASTPTPTPTSAPGASAGTRPRLNFVCQGRGPLVVLSHALGCDLHMWDPVAALLERDFTVLRYDHRNHGGSETVPGAFGIDALADDAAALIRAHGAGGAPAHFVGVSMGGMTAQALAARQPALLRSIVVANAAAHYPDPAPWRARVAAVRADGLAAIAEGAVARWLTPAFAATPDGAALARLLRDQLLSNDDDAYIASCEAVAAIDLLAGDRRIALPALVIAGTQDEATPPALSEEIAAAIPGARLVTIDAAHLSAVERPAEFVALLMDFWRGL